MFAKFKSKYIFEFCNTIEFATQTSVEVLFTKLKSSDNFVILSLLISCLSDNSFMFLLCLLKPSETFGICWWEKNRVLSSCNTGGLFGEEVIDLKRDCDDFRRLKLETPDDPWESKHVSCWKVELVGDNTVKYELLQQLSCSLVFRSSLWQLGWYASLQILHATDFATALLHRAQNYNRAIGLEC